MNEKREILYTNHSFLMILEYNSKDEVLNRNIKEIIYSYNYTRKEYLKIWREVEEKGKWGKNIHLTKKNQEQPLCWLSLKKIQINKQTYYLGTLLNIKKSNFDRRTSFSICSFR